LSLGSSLLALWEGCSGIMVVKILQISHHDIFDHIETLVSECSKGWSKLDRTVDRELEP